MAEFRIEYTIQRREKGRVEFVEIGFGSSGGWASIGEALYDAQSAIENRAWEVGEGMPNPDDAEAVSDGE